MTVNTNMMTINPKKAKAYLELNTGNRPLNDRHVAFLAEQIKSGHWQFNGEAIKISKTDKLMDGQHRLSAIIKAGRGIKSLVITGLEDTIFDTLDTGKLRSHSDVFALMGEKHVTNLPALLSLLSRYYDKDWSSHKDRISNVGMEALLERYPDARDFAGKAIRSPGLLSPRTIEFCHYVFSKKNKEEANEFITKLCTGNDLPARSPISAIRNKIMDAALRGSKYNGEAQIVLVFKAWNAVRSGASMSRPRYKPGEKIERAK